jgi:hypothetical protein
VWPRYGFYGPSQIMPLDTISACPMRTSGFFLNSSGVLNLPPKQRQQTLKSQLSRRCAGCLNVKYRQRVLTAVYEATTERLYSRTYALSCFKCYRETLAHGRAFWQPVIHVLPCDGPSAAASECSSMLPSNSSVVSDSLPPA